MFLKYFLTQYYHHFSVLANLTNEKEILPLLWIEESGMIDEENARFMRQQMKPLVWVPIVLMGGMFVGAFIMLACLVAFQYGPKPVEKRS